MKKKTILAYMATLVGAILFSSSACAAEYTLAVWAHNGVDSAVEQWQSTVDVLNKDLPQHHFELRPIINLGQIPQQASAAGFDFILTNPSSFVELKIRYDARALATLNNKRANTEQSKFGSVIFTHVKNIDIINIEDLKGKKLMAVSATAFGGWRVAWLEMLEQSFNPYRDLKSLVFAKNSTQPEVVEAVHNGRVDAGVVRTDLLERLASSGKADLRYFRILNNKDIKGFPFFVSTSIYPEWAFVALKHISKEDAQQVTLSLLRITENSWAAQSGKYMGWIAPLNYGGVDDLMETLQVGPYSNKAAGG